MGGAKRMLELQETYHGLAFEILLEIGAIKTCEFHSDFYYDNYKYDKNEIYARATSRLKQKYSEYNDFKIFDDEINDIMTYAADGPDDCPYCAKIAKE